MSQEAQTSHVLRSQALPCAYALRPVAGIHEEIAGIHNKLLHPGLYPSWTVQAQSLG
jgi:hypothetical protein